VTRIYYFSGTGNTLWSARKIAEIIGANCELVNIGVEAQKSDITIEADAVVLLFPSYAYGLPIVVRGFLQKATFKTPYIAAFVTFGTSPGGTLAEACRILKRKKCGISYCDRMYFGRIPSVENYIAIFGPPKEKTTLLRLAMQREATDKAARCIVERHTNRINTFHPCSAFVSMLFTMLGIKIFYKYYRVNNNCNGCGICEKMCPVSAITLKDSRPVFSKNCEHCQGCLNWCPHKAITFGRLKSDSPRYHHPEINESDILRSLLFPQPG
jgi:ferredoxin